MVQVWEGRRWAREGGSCMQWHSRLDIGYAGIVQVSGAGGSIMIGAGESRGRALGPWRAALDLSFKNTWSSAACLQGGVLI